MARHNDSIQRTINGLTRQNSLAGAVRRAVHPSRAWIRTGIIAAGLAAGMPGAIAAPFPPVFPLVTLFPANGGDGSEGFVLRGIGDHDLSGASVSAAGDVNADGIDDVIIGAFGAMPGGQPSAGASYLVFGSTEAFEPFIPLATLYPGGGGDGSRGVVLAGFDEGDFVGSWVSGAGDVNSDGIDDVLIGASGEEAAAYVVFGSTTAFPAVFPLAQLYPGAGGDGSRGFVLYGRSVDRSGRVINPAGDVNGDGITDIILAGGGDGSGGGAYVVFGRDTAQTGNFPALFPLASLLAASGGDGSEGFVLIGAPNEGAGISANGAGDVNGDGVDDVIIGAPSRTPGAGYVVFGTTQGVPAELELASLRPSEGGDGSRGFVLQGIDSGDNTGGEVSRAGDVNGDGLDDLIIVNSLGDPGGTNGAGEVFVVFGSTQPFPPLFPLATLYPAAGGDGTRGFVLTGTDASDSAGSAVSARYCQELWIG